MAIPANLDAFLPREDFNADGQHSSVNEFQEMGLTELRDQFVHILRKPDFQRTTDDWIAEQITQFVKSFAESDVIPGLIFWAAPLTGNILVIDGAHRISAMLAWMEDDYGDKNKSSDFFGYEVSADQIAAANATRNLIKEKFHTYKQLSESATNPTATVEQKALAISMTAMRFKIQWVRGNAEKAEESFYRINLRSIALNKTEIKLIRERKKPNQIATRAIIQNGEGHQFWKKFSELRRDEVKRLSKTIHSLLFDPPLPDAIRSAHLPIGGKSYAGTAMEIALDLVEFASDEPSRGLTAQRTVDVLKRTEGTLSKINGKHNGCLGLHPAVYFYSHSTGKHQPAALMAVIQWFSKFDKKKFQDFTSVREFFEKFLIKNAASLGATVSARGSRGRSVPTLIAYYELVLNELLKGSNPKKIFKAMRKNQRLKAIASKLSDFTDYGVNFSEETKSAVFMLDAVNAAPECRVCGARYQPDSVNSDHQTSKSDGGIGTPTNLGPTHFYCNSAKTVLAPLITAAKRRIQAQL